MRNTPIFGFGDLKIEDALKYCKKLEEDLNNFDNELKATDSFDEKFLKDEQELFNEITSKLGSLLRLTKRFNRVVEKREVLR